MLAIADIERAHSNLKDVVIKTPFLKNYRLSKTYDCNIYLKREDMQQIRSFKIRGAYHKISTLSKEETLRGIVCASAGNHAQGVAFACAHLQIKGTIYMPMTTPKQKISKVKFFGGDWISIVLVGDTYDDCQAEAFTKSKEENLPFIHAFNDETVMAGQGSVAIEMLEEINVPIDILIVAVGGGGLISGVGSYFKQKSPNTKIIAVEASGAPALYEARKAGNPVLLDKIDSFADGIAVKCIGDKTFAHCQEIVDDIYLVPEGKICSTILSLYNDEAIVVEPAGAVSISALDYITDEIKGKNVAIIICGGNNDISRTEEIRERALMYEGKKHYFIIRFPQRAGAFKDFLNVLGPEDDITYFEYTKKNNRETGPAMVGIELKNKDDFDSLIDRMHKASINFEHINHSRTLFEMLV
jgi:threonine dehydratase